MPSRPGLFLALLALACAAPARATTVTVPDNYATIAAAIASGADVVVVRDGTYSENVVISRALTLKAADPAFTGYSTAFPVITGTLTLNQPTTTSGYPIIVDGFHIKGAVTHTLGIARSAILRECRLDQGVVSNGLLVGSLALRGCIVRGSVTVNPEYIEMTCCTLIGGGLVANYENDGNVRDNFIIGPAAAGIDVTSDDGGCPIFENTVIGTTNGIIVRNAASTSVTYNEVDSTTSTAFVATATGSTIPSATFQHNYIQKAGGDGFNVVGSMNVSYNVLRTVGGYGIYAYGSGSMVTAPITSGNVIDDPGAMGICVVGPTATSLACNNNTVMRAGSAGLWLGTATTANYNVIGRCLGSGIFTTAANGTATFRNNTCYLNGAYGLVLGGTATTSILNNISYGNGWYGLRWSGTGTPTVGCNDWFGNLYGTTSGVLPGATDYFVNPLFCNLPNDDVWLAASSPIWGTSCGQIGALSIDCSTPVSVPAETAAPLRLSVGERPTTGPVAFAWGPLTEPGVIEVFDASGARIWSRAVPAGSRGAHWDAGTGAGAVRPGVYFARLRSGVREERQRIVVLK